MNNWINIYEASLCTGLCESRILELVQSGTIQPILTAGGMRFNRRDLEAIFYHNGHAQVHCQNITSNRPQLAKDGSYAMDATNENVEINYSHTKIENYV